VAQASKPVSTASIVLLSLSVASANTLPQAIVLGLDRPPRVAGILTRASRAVERKKYGQSGVRRRFQFSNR